MQRTYAVVAAAILALAPLTAPAIAEGAPSALSGTLLVTAENSNRENFYAVSPSSGAPKMVAQEDQEIVAVTPDGSTVIGFGYDSTSQGSSHGGMTEWPSHGSTTRAKLVWEFGDLVNQVAVSPSGKEVALVLSENTDRGDNPICPCLTPGLWVVGINGQSAKLVLAGVTGSIAWSPGGKEIGFTGSFQRSNGARPQGDSGSVSVITPTGRQLHLLVPDVGADLTSLSWAPSKTLVATTTESGVAAATPACRLVELSSKGNVKFLPPLSSISCLANVVWSPSGTEIAATEQFQSPNPWIKLQVPERLDVLTSSGELLSSHPTAAIGSQVTLLGWIRG